jgi:hypothetical protein
MLTVAIAVSTMAVVADLEGSEGGRGKGFQFGTPSLPT